jgi:hypothetical protein
MNFPSMRLTKLSPKLFQLLHRSDHLPRQFYSIEEHVYTSRIGTVGTIQCSQSTEQCSTEESVRNYTGVEPFGTALLYVPWYSTSVP